MLLLCQHMGAGMQQLDGSAVAEDTALQPPAAVTYAPVLYLVCPFYTPRLRRVELSLDSLHSKDVLILDLGLTVRVATFLSSNLISSYVILSFLILHADLPVERSAVVAGDAVQGNGVLQAHQRLAAA